MNKKNQLLALVFVLFGVFLLTCRSDDTLTLMCSPTVTPEPEPEPCDYNLSDFTEWVENVDSTFNDLCPLGSWEVYPEKYNYSNPVYNPNNQNEIAFIRNDNEKWGLCNNDLCIFNFCTGELKVIVEEACEKAIDWSTKDWIAFAGAGQFLYKIKTDGDSLTRLSFAGAVGSPSWTVTGDSLTFKEINVGNSKFFLINSSGNVLNVVEELKFTATSKTSNNQLISYSAWGNIDYGLHYYDLTNETTQQIEFLDISYSNDSVIIDTDWIDNNESILWVTKKHLFKTNIFTQERSLLSDGADNRWYQSAAPSPDGEYILVERQDRKFISLCEISVISSIYVLDADGGNSRRVLFPE